MADGRDDGSIAPRRSLGGPILPPPPPEMAADSRKAEEDAAAARRAESERPAASARQSLAPPAAPAPAQKVQRPAHAGRRTSSKRSKPDTPTAVAPPAADKQGAAPRRTRRAQLRLVQVDAWSVMKTSFLLSIALGIVLVVAVAIIWSVLGAAGVWDSINSIVQQAVGSDSGKPFDIQEYAGTSRVLGFTMLVAVLDVILITAVATLGAFLYNLSAALLGGIEVTLAEDN
jgi:hypothetical protein